MLWLVASAANADAAATGTAAYGILWRRAHASISHGTHDVAGAATSRESVESAGTVFYRVTRGTLCIVAVAFLLCAHTIVRSMTVSRHRRRGTAAERRLRRFSTCATTTTVVTLRAYGRSLHAALCRARRSMTAGDARGAESPATAACTSGVQFPKLRLNGPAQKLWRCTDGVPAVMLPACRR